METVTHGEFASAAQRGSIAAGPLRREPPNPRNERIHCVAIPLIMLSLLGLLWAAHPWLALASLLPAWCITPGCRWCSW